MTTLPGRSAICWRAELFWLLQQAHPGLAHSIARTVSGLQVSGSEASVASVMRVADRLGYTPERAASLLRVAASWETLDRAQRAARPGTAAAGMELDRSRAALEAAFADYAAQWVTGASGVVGGQPSDVRNREAPLPYGLSSPLSSEQQSRVGVYTVPGFAVDNRAFGESMYQISRTMGGRVADGSISQFRQLWDFLNLPGWRTGLAIDLQQDLDDPLYLLSLTMPRARDGIGMHTDLTGRYAFAVDRVQDLAGQPTQAGPFSEDVRAGLDAIGGAAGIDGFPFRVYVWTAYGNLESEHGGERQRLTTFIVPDTTDPAYQAIVQKPPSERTEQEQLALALAQRVYHLQPQSIEAVQTHLESLYRNAMRSDVSREEFIDTVARMYWWLSHAQILGRGNSSINEAAIRSVCEARGISLPPWAAGTTPDFAALLNSEQDFVRGFGMMFEQPLVGAATPMPWVGPTR
jgi:hypothetical protein